MLGAEIKAKLKDRTRRGTSLGPDKSMGQRNAY